MCRLQKLRLACAAAVGTAALVASAGEVSAQPLPASCAFTDNPLVPGVTVIKAVHLTELRNCVNDLRIQRGLSATSWTDPVIIPQQTTVRAVYVTELRTSLTAVYIHVGRTPPDFGPALTPNVSMILASYFTSLRDASVALAGCTYQISPGSITVGSGATTGSVTVSTFEGCGWTAVSQAGWIQVTSGQSGTGSGTVSYSLATNESTQQRSGTIIIGSQTFSIQQGGFEVPCTYQLTPASLDAWMDAVTNTILVTAPSGCAWTATSLSPDLTIESGTGNGPGKVRYSLTANTSPSNRVSQLSVEGHTHTVTQLAGVESPVATGWSELGGNACGLVPIMLPPSVCDGFPCYGRAYVCIPGGAPDPWPLPPPAQIPSLSMDPPGNPPGNVVRGASVTFTLNNAEGADISNWRFLAAIGTGVARIGGNGQETWAGQIVNSGEVRVDVLIGNVTFPVRRTFTVGPRAGWMFPAVPASKQPQNYVAVDAKGQTIPPFPGRDENGNSRMSSSLTAVKPELGIGWDGVYNVWVHWDQLEESDANQVVGGPNDGYMWVADIRDLTVANWVIHPDAENPGSQFFTMQCNNFFPGPQNSCSSPQGIGFLHGSTYRDGVERHEVGQQNSHHAQYVSVLNDPAKNLKAGAEGFVLRVIGLTKPEFLERLQTTVLNLRVAQIYAEMTIEPCAAECDTGCVNFLGYVNTILATPSGYAQCPQ